MTKKKPTLKDQVQVMTEALQTSTNNQEMLEEAIAALEAQLIEQGWISIFGGGKELSKSALNTLYDLSRAYWLKNPLIRRPIEVQGLYVFGQGMTVAAESKPVDEIVQKFIMDRKNYVSFTGHSAWMQNERDLALAGNIFYAMFTEPGTGRVTIRTIPLYEIADIITNPEDMKEPWYYRREFTTTQFDEATGNTTQRAEIAYYPDWKYTPDNKPQEIGGKPIVWDAPVYHLKTNCLPDMKFGVPEFYSAIDWAKAYKRFLENWGKLTEAYARFAWNLTTKGGQAKITAAKARIENLLAKTDPNASGDIESAYSAAKQLPVASVITSGENTQMTAIRTQGATTAMEDSRYFRLMVASTSGIPDQILAGDPSTGNLATARAMERPLELQFRNRQTLWSDVWWDICQYVIDQAILSGTLDGHEQEDTYTGEITYVLSPITTDEGEIVEQSRNTTITFPPLLEHDVMQDVQAIIAAGTLENKALAGTMDRKTMAELLLHALKVENANEILEKIPEDPPFERMSNPPAPDTGGFGGIDYTEESLNNLLKDTIKDMRETIRKSDTPFEEADEEGKWVTINGNHVLIGKDGTIKSGFGEGKTPEQAFGKGAGTTTGGDTGKTTPPQQNRLKGAELDKFYDDFENKHQKVHLIGAEYADKDSLIHISENFDKITEKYPEANITGLSFDSIPEKEGKILAATNPDNELIFNTNVFSGSKEKAISTIKNSQDRGWMVKTSDPVGGILAHEYGHALYQEMYKDERMHSHLNELSKTQFTKEELSEYAFTNHEEAFAEGFAAINYGSSRESLKSEYVKKQKAIIEEFKKSTYRVKRGI